MSSLHRISGCERTDRKADVVFIHGLGGDPFKTWRHGDDETHSWPHWVGAEFPEVGVWSLGYAASPSKWARLGSLFRIGSRDSGYALPLPDRARQVADRMVQQGLGKRPLLFVGHSLGGLLTKQILRVSADAGAGDRLRTLVDSTASVLFLGTPHTGADLATFADKFRTIFGTTVAIETLRAHDPHLRDLYDWYRQHAPAFSIETVTYYETRGVAGGTVTIVNPSSSHPGMGRDPVGLEEDHLTLAKPRNRDAQVCDALRELIRAQTSGPRPPPSSSQPAPPPAAAPSAPPVVVRVEVPSSPAQQRIPRELPPRAERYFGRVDERERLISRLRERRHTAVVGPGGLGKTALAAEALHALGDAALAALYPDGSVYLDLYASRANRDAVWSRLANRIAGPGFLEQSPPRERAEEACRGRHLLLTIEGGEEADGQDGRAELAELLTVLPGEAVRLLLTRNAAQALPAESIPLREALPPDDAAALLDSLVGRRLGGESRSQLLTLLAGHPLALSWAGNLLARDDEHPQTLLRDWDAAALPPLNDPIKQTHTLRWLYDRSTRGLDADAEQVLAAAGLLAHAPVPLGLAAAALDGTDHPARARVSLRALVSAGLMRIEIAQADHWQFSHVLAHRYARDHAATAQTLALQLAASLGELLNADCILANEPAARTRVELGLAHTGALLRSPALTGDAAWPLLANPLLYEWQSQLLDRGRSDLARNALNVVEVWMAGWSAAEAELPEQQREYSMLQRRWGDLLVLQGDLSGARTRYEAALAIAQRLVESDPENMDWQRDLSISFSQLGDVQSAQGDLPGARTRYEASLAIRRRLAGSDPGNAGWQRDLSVSFNQLGDVQATQGDLSGARARYEASLAILQRLAESDPENAGWQRDLSVSFGRLGDLQAAQGDLPGARTRYEAALAIVQRLAESDPGNAGWQRDLSVSFEKLGNVQSAQGDLPGARARYEASLAILQRLAESDPKNAGWQRDLSVSFNKLGDVQSARGDLPGARTRYEASLAIRKRLVESDPKNAGWQRDLSVSSEKLGNVQAAQGDLPGARTRYEASLAIRQRLAESDPGNASWQRDLGCALTRMATVSEKAGDWVDALRHSEASLAIGRRLAALDPTNAMFRNDVAASEAQVARISRQIGDGA